MPAMDMSNMDILILIALSGGPLHGYAAMQGIREQSGGRQRVSTGTFYRRLSLLIDEGLVEEAGPPRGDADPRRGAHYRATSRGREALARERDRMAALVAAVDALRSPSRGRRA